MLCRTHAAVHIIEFTVLGSASDLNLLLRAAGTAVGRSALSLLKAAAAGLIGTHCRLSVY